MKGSKVQNIKFDPDKEKIVNCNVCEKPIVVGKFAKNEQNCSTVKGMELCDTMKKLKQRSKTSKKTSSKRLSVQQGSEKDSIGSKLREIMVKLGFDIDNRLRYKKSYAVDGGGVITVYPHVESNKMGNPSQLEYFATVEQRAVGINENFRKFMPPDAASDCELIVAELGKPVTLKPQVGTTVCDKCGATTYEFGVDPKRCKVLCIKPNNCFKKHFTVGGAESEE